MTVRRGLLYPGVFLVAVGSVLLLGESGGIDRTAAGWALRLWPLALIGTGLALVLSRTPLGLAGGIVAAALPGLLLGTLIVAAPSVGPICRDALAPVDETREGTLGPRATVDLALDCGRLSVSSQPGGQWRLEAGGPGSGGVVEAGPDRLSVASAGAHGFPWRGDGHDWRLRLPAGSTLDLRAAVNAGEARFDLGGASLRTLSLEVNAGAAEVDLDGASLSRLDVAANAAAVSVRLPAADLSAVLDVNGGSLELCAPPDLGLRVRGETVLGSTSYGGLVRRDGAWESPDYSSSPFHADVTVSVAVGSVTVNPVGGCR